MSKVIKKIQWKNILVLVCLLSIFLIPYLVFAEVNPGTFGSPEATARVLQEQSGGMTAKGLLERLGGKAGYETSAGKNSVESIVVAVINGVLGILGIIFFAYVLHAGYLWMTAQGNEEQVKKAKGEITNAIVGLIVIIAAYAIVNYVIFALLESYGGTTAE